MTVFRFDSNSFPNLSGIILA